MVGVISYKLFMVWNWKTHKGTWP